jgi:hypothetical protein
MTTAFERARRGTNPKPVSLGQRAYLEDLARKAGVELDGRTWDEFPTAAIRAVA